MATAAFTDPKVLFIQLLTEAGIDTNRPAIQSILASFSSTESESIGGILNSTLNSSNISAGAPEGKTTAIFWSGEVTIDGYPYSSLELAETLTNMPGSKYYIAADTEMAGAVRAADSEINQIIASLTLDPAAADNLTASEFNAVTNAADKMTDIALSQRFAAAAQGDAVALVQAGQSAESVFQTEEAPFATNLKTINGVDVTQSTASELIDSAQRTTTVFGQLIADNPQAAAGLSPTTLAKFFEQYDPATIMQSSEFNSLVEGTVGTAVSDINLTGVASALDSIRLGAVVSDALDTINGKSTNLLLIGGTAFLLYTLVSDQAKAAGISEQQTAIDLGITDWDGIKKLSVDFIGTAVLVTGVSVVSPVAGQIYLAYLTAQGIVGLDSLARVVYPNYDLGRSYLDAFAQFLTDPQFQNSVLNGNVLPDFFQSINGSSSLSNPSYSETPIGPDPSHPNGTIYEVDYGDGFGGLKYVDNLSGDDYKFDLVNTNSGNTLLTAVASGSQWYVQLFSQESGNTIATTSFVTDGSNILSRYGDQLSGAQTLTYYGLSSVVNGLGDPAAQALYQTSNISQTQIVTGDGTTLNLDSVPIQEAVRAPDGTYTIGLGATPDGTLRSLVFGSSATAGFLYLGSGNEIQIPEGAQFAVLADGATITQVLPSGDTVTSNYNIGSNGAPVAQQNQIASQSGVTATEQASPGGDLNTEVDTPQLSVDISDQYKQDNPSAQQVPSNIAGDQIGQIFGTQIGEALAGKNVFARIGAGSVLSAVLADVGKTLEASATQDIDIGSAINQGFGSFGSNLLQQVESTGSNAVSSFLVAEFDQGLGLGQSFGTQLFNSAVSSVTSKLISNAVTIATADLNGATSNLSLFSNLDANIITSVSSFLGGYLAHEILAPQSTAGAVGSAIGSGIGSLIGAGLATPAGTAVSGSLAEIGVNVVTDIGLDAGSLALDGIGAIILPGIGALLGALLGTVIGDWLNNIINGTPSASCSVAIDPTTERFKIVGSSNKNHGNIQFCTDIANAASSTLNYLMDAIGGESIQNGNLDHIYGMRGNQMYFNWFDSTHGDNELHFNNDANALLDYSVINTLKQLEIAGGDMILKRAIANSTATTVSGLEGDIAVAEQYEQYTKNKGVINLLIELEPQSTFAAGWVVVLAKAHELGLDTWSPTDFRGGISSFLQSLSLDKVGVKPEDVNFTISGSDLKLDIVSGGQFIPTITIQNYAQYFNLQQFAAGMPGDTRLYGEGGNVFDSRGVASYEHGKGGGDTFVYNVGYGALEIDETDSGTNPANILKLGSGISAAQLSVTYDGAGNLFLTDGTTGDQIKIDGGYADPARGIDGVQFADGTAWTRAQLMAQAVAATPSATKLYGTVSGTAFDGGGTATYIHGLGGGDTFVYNAGYGALEIDETDTSASPDNTLKFGSGISPAQIKVTRDEAGNLFLDDGVAGDRIKIDAGALDSSHGVQSVQFADGTTWSPQTLINQTTIGGPGNTKLYGTGGNIFDSKGIATYAHGEGGGDTFIYNSGYGQLEIDETDNSAASDNVLQLGSGIQASQVTVVADQAGNLFILDQISGDEIKIDGELLGSSRGIESVLFADGTVWTRQQLLNAASNAAQQANVPATGLCASGSGQTLDTGGTVNYVHGDGGYEGPGGWIGDTFVFDKGYGFLEIDETDTNSNRDNVLSLGSGITAKNLEVTGDEAGNIFLDVTGTNLTHDEIKLDGELSDPSRGVQSLVFADGTVWTRQQLIAESTIAQPSDRLYGTTTGETYDGQGISTYAYGKGGGDTFVYDAGYGVFEVEEVDSSATPDNVLKLGGIAPSQIQVTGDESGNLFITDGIAGDRLKLDGQLLGQACGVQSIQFGDGTVWTAAQLDALATTGSASNTKLYGGYGDTYDSKGIATYEHSLGGGSTFIYNQGYGKLEIDESDATTTTPDNVLQLGASITASQVLVSGDSSGNVTLQIGGGDKIQLDNQLFSPADGVQQVQFADGTVWTRQQLDDLATTGSAGNTTLYGAADGDTFDGKGTAHVAHGRGGGDTFIYNTGYGFLEIDEPADFEDNVLKLGPGIKASQVQVTSDTNGNVYLTDGQAGDQIKLDGQLTDLSHGIERVEFADGTVWVRSNLIPGAIVGTQGNDRLIATSGSHTFDGLGGVDYEQGKGGGDIFLYDQNYGFLEINESDFSGANNLLQMGPGITPSDVRVSSDGSNIFITDGINGDRIEIDNYLQNSYNGVQFVSFADGTVWDRQQVLQQETTGQIGRLNLYGTGAAEIFDSKGFSRYESGGGGGDTFVYNQGYAALEINESNFSSSASNVLQFGAGITAAQITVTADSSGNLYLTDGTAGDWIKLDNQLAWWGGVQSVDFADGTVWSRSQLIQQETTGSPTNTQLYGTSGAETFDSKGYATYEQGGGGNDTFIYNQGYGFLEINQNGSSSDASVLKFGAGITAAQIAVTADSSGNLYLTDGTAGDRIKLDGVLSGSWMGPQSVQFADGTVWSRQQLIAQETTGAPWNTSLYGSNGPDIFDSKGYARYEKGGGGGDIFIYNVGYGALEIDETDNSSSPRNFLQLGAGITASQVKVTSDRAGNLYLTDGTAGDRIKIDGMLSNPADGIQAVEFADGTFLTSQQLISLATPISTITGTSTAKTYDGQGAVSYVSGSGGGDTFVYNKGYGALEIAEVDYSGATNILEFGAGIAPFQVEVTADNSGNIYLTDGTSGDQIKLDDQLGQWWNGIQSVQFADGTVWSSQQLIQQETTGRADNLTLYGSFSGADIFDSKGFATYESGGGGYGGDTFIYNQGYGALEIAEVAYSGDNNVLKLGAGITASQVEVTAGSSGSLYLTDGTSGDQIKLDDQLGQWWNGIQSVQFADGTVWSRQQLIQQETTGRADNLTLYGSFSGADIFDSKGYATYEQGGGGYGGDTFIYNQGYGALEINEVDYSGANNVLKLGAGITTYQLEATADGSGNLYLTDGTSGDQIKLDGMLSSRNGIQTIQFADGTVWNRQQLIELETTGRVDNLYLYGTSGADTFDSKGYAFYEQGGGGGDTFIYNAGYGALEINEADYSHTASNVLQLGAGITASQVEVTGDSSGNIYLTDGTAGDRIKLDDALSSSWNGVQSVQFADGTVWSRQQVILEETTGAPWNTTLYGTSGADIFDSKGYATYENGGGGNDTFIYNPGYGALEIDETDFSHTANNVLQLGAGITASQVEVTGDRWGNVYLTDGTAGDRIKLDSQLAWWGGVQSVQFSDGTVWTSQQLILEETTGAPWNTTLYGTSGADIFDSKGYATYENGGGGNDTFIYNPGYGALEIDETDFSHTANNVLQLGAGITASQVEVTGDRWGNVYLTDGTAGDRIKLDSQLAWWGGVQSVQFSDGTVWTNQQVIQQELTGAPWNTALYGTAGADIFDSKGYANYENGGGGNDTFIYNRGYGALEINETDYSSTASNVLKFGAGITASQVRVTGDSSGNIYLTDGAAGDRIELDSQTAWWGGVQSVQFADGTVWTNQQLVYLSTLPNAIIGTPAPETFDGQGAVSYISGGGGGDTFVYNQGYGALEIYEVDNSSAPDNVLKFGAGIAPAQVQVTADSSGNIYLTDGVSGDQIKLDSMLNGLEYGVQSVDFADGTVWNRSQIVQEETTGSPTNTKLYGTSGADIFDSKGSATYEQGGGGGDTFICNMGYGALEINETDSSPVANNILKLGPGIAAPQVQATTDSAGNLYLTDGTTGDQIKLDGFVNGPANGVQLISFSDGTLWNRAQLILMAGLGITGTPGADNLTGTSGPDVFDGKGGYDLETGNGGGDTFVFNAGYGYLEISEYDTSANPDNSLQLGTGITESQLGVTGNSSGNLYLTDSTTGDQIKIDNMLGDARYGVQSVRFADGTVWSRSQLIQVETTGSLSNTKLYGTSGADIFDSKGYATYEQGGGGGDTFLYNQGYGALEINELDFSSTTSNVLKFGAGITSARVQVTADSNGNLYLTDGTAGDQIKLDNYLSASYWGTISVQFADGTTWSPQQLVQQETTGSPSNTKLYGTSGANIFDSKGYATYEQGGGGGDTFLYNQGYGALEINELDFSSTTSNVLKFGAGITSARVQVTADSNGNLYLTDGTAGDQIKLDNYLSASYWGTISVQFADGTTWSPQQLVQQETTGSPSNTKLYGTSGANIFDSKGYATYEQGGGGGDTFLYNQGYGALEINELDFSSTTSDVLKFGAGITSAQVQVTADSNGNLYLTDGTAGDQIKLDNYLSASYWGTISVQFADGTTWSPQQLVQQETTGSPSNTKLYGTSGANIFDSKGYATYEQGGGGGDTFLYNQGYGVLEINELDFSSTTSNVLKFGAGIAPAQVVVTGDSNGNLYLTDGTAGDQIKLDNYLSASYWGTISVQFADGTTWSQSQLVTYATTITGTPASTKLYGTPGADTFNSKGYATYEQGNGGADTFIYNPGYGALEINEADYSSPSSVLKLGAGISAAQVQVTADSSGNLYLLTDGTAGDRIKLDNQLAWWGGVQSVQFADGTVWSRQQLIAQETTGAPGNTQLYGTGGAETFDSKGYATYEQGGGGNDTFIYNQGYGFLEINQNGSSSDASVLKFGAGITAAQIAVTADSSGNLYLTDGTAGDRIKLDGVLSWSWMGPQSVQFADGTVWSRQQLIAQETTGAPGNTQLYGTGGAETFDSKGYATYEQGGGGNDTFIYNQGYGALEINEADSSPSSVLKLGAGISAAQVQVTADSSGNLYLTDGTAGDRIKLDNQLAWWGGVQSVDFADGTVWSRSQLIQQETTGSPTNTQLYGTSGADTFDSKGFATYEQGNGGADTFIYNQGYGALEINEADSSPSSVLKLGAGISAAQVQVTADSSGNLYLLTDGTAGDRIKLDNQLAWWGGVQSVDFADGTVWSRSQLIQQETTGSPTNTQLYGTSGADTFDSKGFATYEQGNGGADTFIYNQGYGALEINEADSSPSSVLKLGAGISAAQVQVTADSSGNLYLLTDGTAGDRIKLDNQLAWWGGVQSVDFADGTVWSRSQLIQQETTGSPTNTQLYGTSGADTFDSKGYATYEQGNGGADTFLYNQGYGFLEINQNGSSSDASVLKFGAGITAAQIAVTADSSGNLYLTDGTAGDRIKLDGALSWSWMGPQSVQFADGTVWSRQQLISESTSATSMVGTSASETFDGQGNVSYISGGGGNDTFIYNQGYGFLEINQNGSSSDASVLKFGAGITAAQIAVTADSSGNLYLTDGTAGDRIKLDGVLSWSWMGPQSVQFADGTVWSRQQLIAQETTGAPGNTQLYGTGGAETFDSKGYATYEQGGGGSDTFLYNQGYGFLEINQNGSSSDASVLKFGAGITAAQIAVTADSSGNLYLTDGTAGDRIKLDGVLSWSWMGPQSVQFADGTVWSRQQLIAQETTGAPGNTQLYGTGGAETFDSKGYATYEQGGGGNDTFIYNQGYGFLEINQNGSSSDASVLKFGAGITAAQIAVTADSSGNLYLTDGTAGDRIKLDGVLSWSWMGPQSVQFADGTVWSRQQLIAQETTGAPGNTQLYGTGGAETFDSKGYATYEQGGGGNDTFIYNQGYGFLEINQNGSSSDASVLKFGAGITAAQIAVTADSSGNLYLTDGTAGDRIKLDGVLSWSWMGPQSVQFADGTVWSRQQLIAQETTGAPTNTQLYGTGGAETFDSKGYATYEQGGGGNDTFIYNQGYGFLEINQNGSSSDASVLKFGAGITAAQIAVTADSSGNLYLTDGTAGDRIKLDGVLSWSWMGPQSVQFADGTVWSRQQLIAQETTGAPGNTQLYGTGGAETFDSKGYATYEQGGGGNDTFIYNQGYGFLEINQNGSSSDASVLKFGAGITAAQIAVTADSSGNLYLTDGTAGDRIKLDGALSWSWMGPQSVQFADGTVWSRAQLIQQETSGSTALSSSGSGATVNAATGESLTLSSDTINVAASATASINGNSNTINAGKNNTLTVSGSGDNFVFQSAFGQDVINGFASTDQMMFSTSDFANWSALLSQISQSGSNTVITLDASDTITLKNVTASSLQSSQFNFH